MSTKTTFKRVALVAVAALSLGVLSVAPSSAAPNALLTFTSGDGAPGTDLNTGNGVAGPFNYVLVDAAPNTGTAPDYVVTTDSTFGATTGGAPVVSADRKSLVGTANVGNQIQVMTPAVGTVTVSYWKRNSGILAAAPSETVVITVNAAKQAGIFSLATSSAILNSGETVTATTDATPTPVSTVNEIDAAATIVVSLKDALLANYNDTLTATVISGSAYVNVINDSSTIVSEAITDTNKLPSHSALTANGKAYVTVWANGFAGPTTIRLTLSNGTVVATKVVTFSSTTVATLTATVVNAYVSDTKGNTGAITVVAKDAAGNVISAPAAAITAVSSNTAKISNPTGGSYADGKFSYNVAAVAGASGPVTITFTSGTVSTTASITAAGVKATKFTIVPSTLVANAGDKVTYTLTAADANGPIANGEYVATFLSSVTTSSGYNGILALAPFSADTITVTNGIATADIYMPFVAGNFTTTWTLKAASSNLDTALLGTSITTTVAISNPGVDAATDAANEATDAANAATDAALAAADAADAATAAAEDASAAVAKLAKSVNTKLKALKAQLKSLIALVNKLR